jgi:drug/metabolite transporter (DMT)-like permease
MGVTLAIIAAACWGLSDFLGGLTTRRVPVVQVLLVIETAGLAATLTVLAITGEALDFHCADAVSAAAAGLSGVLGLACFYRALAIGTMSVVAPISAAGVVLPVVVGVATGDRPSLLAGAGLVVIVVGVALASRERHEDAAAVSASRQSVVLALIAALGFGGFFVLSDGPADVSVLWTLALVRVAPIPFLAAIVAVRRPRWPSRRLVLAIAGIGTIDLVATGLIALANTKGELSIVAVVGSMYPVATVVLAAGFLHERLRGDQLVGIVLALVGVVAVAGS